MKILVAIINCHTRKAYADVQRETWIPQLPPEVDYKFFLGPADREPGPDEVFLNCDDSYKGLPNKVQEMVRWALAQGYDFVMKCDDDVVLVPSMWLRSGFTSFDFTGNVNVKGNPVTVPWGFCYVMSRRLMEWVAAKPLPRNNNDEAWVADIAHEHGVYLHKDHRYQLYRGRRELYLPRKRGLRAPLRMDGITRIDGDTFAFCMYVLYQGYRHTPDDIDIKEFRYVFGEAMRLRC